MSFIQTTRRFSKGIRVIERVIIKGRWPSDNQDDDFATDLSGVIRQVHQHQFAVMTYRGHSTAIFYTPEHNFCFFDPAPALCITEMKSPDLLSMLRSERLGVQCDVALISAK